MAVTGDPRSGFADHFSARPGMVSHCYMCGKRARHPAWVNKPECVELHPQHRFGGWKTLCEWCASRFLEAGCLTCMTSTKRATTNPSISKEPIQRKKTSSFPTQPHKRPESFETRRRPSVIACTGTLQVNRRDNTRGSCLNLLMLSPQPIHEVRFT